MARRKGGEFTTSTIDYAYRKADGRDQMTGDPLTDITEVDHIIPLNWAAINAPDISLMQLKSAENARVLNRNTHKERHRNFDDTEVWFLVNYFRSIQTMLLG